MSGANLVSDRKFVFSRNPGCALADFYGHFSSWDLQINAIDADCKHPEGPTCPDSLVVSGTKREIDDSGEWHREATSSSIKPGLLACDNNVVIVAYKKTRLDSTKTSPRKVYFPLR